MAIFLSPSRISISFLMLLFVNTALPVEIPGFLHVCHKDAPTLNQCMISSVENLRPYLVTGVPEYKIPRLEPLVLKDLFSEHVAGMNITTSEVRAYGCSEFFLRSISVDIDSHCFYLDIDIPRLRIEAKYNIEGKLLMIPIKGDGNMDANITDVESKSNLKGELFERDGEQYLRFTSIDIKVRVGGGTVYLDDLFNGDKVVLNLINDVINNNLALFLDELLPIIQKALGNAFIAVGNNIVESFTFKQLFPH